MDDLSPFNLLGSIFENRLRDEQQSLVSGVDILKVELHLLVSGVEKINREYEDSLVTSLFFCLGLDRGGRDPLLVVSIVMLREFPHIRLFVLSFWHHHDIILHFITLHVLLNN